MSGKSLKRTLLKLSLAKRTPSEKLTMGRSVCTCMSGSAYFVSLASLIAELANATDQLQDACAKALNNGIKEKDHLATCERKWHNVMTRIGFKVQNIADQDFKLSALIIVTAGLQVRNGRKR